jgi:hypothetical protein
MESIAHIADKYVVPARFEVTTVKLYPPFTERIIFAELVTPPATQTTFGLGTDITG